MMVKLSDCKLTARGKIKKEEQYHKSVSVSINCTDALQKRQYNLY